MIIYTESTQEKFLRIIHLIIGYSSIIFFILSIITFIAYGFCYGEYKECINTTQIDCPHKKAQTSLEVASVFSYITIILWIIFIMIVLVGKLYIPDVINYIEHRNRIFLSC